MGAKRGRPFGSMHSELVRDRIRTTQLSDTTGFQPNGDLYSVTGAIRHTFELTSRTEAALQLELSKVGREQGDGTVPTTYTGLFAFDFTM